MSHLFHSRVHVLRTFFFVSVLLILLHGCGKGRLPEDPSPSPRPVIQPGKHLARLPTTNIHRIHENLLRDGKEHIREQRYSEAIRDLSRLLALKPKESMELQGRWLLGQAYYHEDDWQNAQGQYKAIVSSATPNPYQNDARKKLSEIFEHLQGQALPPRATHAIRLTLEQLPTPEGFDQGLKKMKGDGVTALLVDLGCKAKVVRSSQAKNSRRVLNKEELGSLLGSYVTQAHRQDLSIFLGVNLRCLGYWHGDPPPSVERSDL